LGEWEEFERIGQLLESQKWIFAKTMPQNPHCYTLRERWGNDEDFAWVVSYIREHGYVGRFGKTRYTYLDVNNHYYWTMGAKLDRTILINRKPLTRGGVYDKIADKYVELFLNEDSRKENKRVFQHIPNCDDLSVLDVGCGAGLFLEYRQPKSYIGIDPSINMLNRIKSNWPDEKVIKTPLSSFVGGTYDLVTALFGTASYLSDAELQRIPSLCNPGGEYRLMFYADDYFPITHKEGVDCPWGLYEGIPEGDVIDLGNYVMVKGRV